MTEAHWRSKLGRPKVWRAEMVSVAVRQHYHRRSKIVFVEKEVSLEERCELLQEDDGEIWREELSVSRERLYFLQESSPQARTESNNLSLWAVHLLSAETIYWINSQTFGKYVMHLPIQIYKHTG